MAYSKSFTAIIVAGGTGTRFNNDKPKQYVTLHDKTILEHTIAVFQSMPQCKDICVVIHPEHERFIKNKQKIHYCFGGQTRQESVYNGLCSLKNMKSNDIILIHDVARPFIKENFIQNLMTCMQDHQAATLALPVTDTLRYENSAAQITRDGLYSIQTPQAFHYGIIKNAHEHAKNTHISYTDDSALASAHGVSVKFIHGSKENFKITYPEDITMAKNMFSNQYHYKTHIGNGFDVHAFDTDMNADCVTICGIHVPHTHALKGHSDADVGLHALTDAILGAIGEGDIGLHFPPSDDTFKNMDSAIFLEHAIKLMQQKNGRVINADVTLICERPKISPYRDAMVSRMAKIMGISTSHVNIKATTTEKLGFTGRSEGIAAQACVSIDLPWNDNGEEK